MVRGSDSGALLLKKIAVLLYTSIYETVSKFEVRGRAIILKKVLIIMVIIVVI
jgi:hypothetical protein